MYSYFFKNKSSSAFSDHKSIEIHCSLKLKKMFRLASCLYIRLFLFFFLFFDGSEISFTTKFITVLLRITLGH